MSLHASGPRLASNKTVAPGSVSPPVEGGLNHHKMRHHEGDLPDDPILGGSARVQVIRPQIELQTETFHLCQGDNETAELTFILRADPGEEQVRKNLVFCCCFVLIRKSRTLLIGPLAFSMSWMAVHTLWMVSGLSHMFHQMSQW